LCYSSKKEIVPKQQLKIHKIIDMRKSTRFASLKKGQISLAPKNGEVSKHNIYQPGLGYVIDHIPEYLKRNNFNHWDTQYGANESFENSWKPRTGPLEFIYNLTQNSAESIIILNMGAGLGDFTRDLAKIPGTFVYHVDFSQKGNDIANEKVLKNKLEERVEIHTCDNNVFLESFFSQNKKADVIFFYGASGSNEPSDVAYQETMSLAAKNLKATGYIWHVTLLQPRITDRYDFRIQDTLGDFPKAPGMPKKVLTEAGLILVQELTEDRPDKHPLEPGGEPIEHLHMVYRGLFTNNTSCLNKFPIGLKEAVDPDWINNG